jgi:hypothetical protein
VSAVSICEKLCLERTHDFGRGLLGRHVNPDGPEAAALIETLVEALDRLARDADQWSGQIEPPPPSLDFAWAILAKARGDA